MSSTNHIIIPKVGSRQNLQQQNVFKHACLHLTPTKQHQLPEPILWKKAMSAFKKFKQKKIKKDRNNTPNEQPPEINISHQRKSTLKLTLRTIHPKPFSDTYSDMHFIHQLSSTLAYYDPNQAPLYQLNINDPPSSITKQYQVPIKYETAAAIQPESKVLKVEQEVMQEENAIVQSIQPRPDDPFIIVRRGSVKKNIKSVKSKFIKKQKIEKNREREGFDEQDETERKKRKEIQNSSMKQKHEERSSDRESSMEEMGKNNRQIFTLEQIMKSAQQRNEENRKSAKSKQNNICRELTFGEPSALSE